MSNTNAYLDVLDRAHALMVTLATDVPGDIGRVVRATLGIDGEVSTNRAINPPAKPIWWATHLLALCCDAYGQPVDRAVPVGACLELFGIAAAVLDVAHDGHEDLLSLYLVGSDIARLAEVADHATGVAVGGATQVAAIWDRRAAIVSNASVALTGLFWQALLKYGPVYGIEQETLLAIGSLLAERLVRICHGQHLDLTSGCDARITLDEYEQIIANKTGEIDGLACEAGALLARAEHHRDLWHSIGLERAVAQQLYDDYVDLAEDLTGGGQVNHPVLYGLAVGSDAERDTILSLLDSIRLGGKGAEDALSQLGTILKDLGAEHYTLACMLVHSQKAIAVLEALQLPYEAETWLRKWVLQAAPLQAHEVVPRAHDNAT